MGKTALLIHVADQINADYGRPFFGYNTQWLAVYVPVQPGARTTADLAVTALASICNESRGTNIARLVLGQLRHRVITLGLIGSDLRNLRTASPIKLCKDKWLLDQGIDLHILSMAIENHLTDQGVNERFAHAIANGSLSGYLAELGRSPNLLPPPSGLSAHALSLLLNEFARVVSIAGIRKVSFLVDDFYRLIYRAPAAHKLQLSTEIRALSVDGPYFAVGRKLFNWVAVIHSHYAPNFTAFWEQARMHQVAPLKRGVQARDGKESVELRAIPMECGPSMLEAYLSFDRPKGTPSPTYPFTAEALQIITRIAGEQEGSSYDPGSLLQYAWQVTCEALVSVNDPAPIGADYVEHVLRGKPLPGPMTSVDEDEPDREELIQGITCPCSCHIDEEMLPPSDAMVRKSGGSGEVLGFRCGACNAPVMLNGAA